MTTTEPDAPEREALGVALAAPVPSIQPPLLDLWRAAGGGTAHYSADMFAELMCLREPALRGVADTGRIDPITRAVIAERERCAQVAEDLGAHYHERLERTRGRSAPFADYLRGQSANRNNDRSNAMTEPAPDPCTHEAVFSDRSIPCTLPRGHEEPHSFYGPQVDA